MKHLQRTWLYQYYAEEGHLRWHQAKDLPPARMRYDSPYDPEARYGNKRSTTWTVYKVHLTETCDDGEPLLIPHVETTRAMITDSELVVPIHEALSAKQMLPSQHLMDAGYTDAELFVTSQPDYGVDVVGPLRSNGSWQAKAEQGFALSSFLINWDAKTVTCPQGQISRHWTPERTTWNQEVIEVSFAKKDCLACPQRVLWTKAKMDPRTLTLRPQLQHEALQAARDC